MLGYVAVGLVLALMSLLTYFTVSYFSESSKPKCERPHSPDDDSRARKFERPSYSVSTDRETDPDMNAKSTEVNLHKSVRMSDQRLEVFEDGAVDTLSFLRNHSNVPESADIYKDRARGSVTVRDREGTPRTFESPLHDPGAMFGSSLVRLSDGRFVIGARGYPMATSAGAIVCYASDGTIVSLVNHPDPFYGAMFGWSIEAVETDDHTFLFAGAPLHKAIGEVYVYVWDDVHPVLAGTLGKGGMSRTDMLRFGATVRNSGEGVAVGYQTGDGKTKDAVYRISDKATIPTMDRYDGEIFAGATLT